MERELAAAGAIKDIEQKKGLGKKILSFFSSEPAPQRLILAEVPTAAAQNYRASAQPFWTVETPAFREVKAGTPPADLVGQVLEFREQTFTVSPKNRGKMQMYEHGRPVVAPKTDKVISYYSTVIGVETEADGTVIYRIKAVLPRPNLDDHIHVHWSAGLGSRTVSSKHLVGPLKTAPLTVDGRTVLTADLHYVFPSKDGRRELTATLRGWTTGTEGFAQGLPVVEVAPGKLVVLDTSSLDWAKIRPTTPAPPKQNPTIWGEVVDGKFIPGPGSPE